MESKKNKHNIIINRNKHFNKALIIVATGSYNDYTKSLIDSAKKNFPCYFYLFTDRPFDYEGTEDTTIIEIDHLGWPAMPLLRFQCLVEYFDFFKENYLFLIDAEAIINEPIEEDVLGYRVGTLHRNLSRFKEEYNYERRVESTAYIPTEKGDNYYACGFVGGQKKEVKKLCEIISENIRIDINNGIRAIWGDESHLNKYFLDNRPSLVLPPSFMCPSQNKYFTKIIEHRQKSFKKIDKKDLEGFLEVKKEDYNYKFRK